MSLRGKKLGYIQGSSAFRNYEAFARKIDLDREKIDEISKKLEELTTIVNRSPVNDDDLEKEVKALNKKEKELRKELEDTLQARIRAEIEFEQASKEFKSAKAEVERLKKMREELTMGAKK